MKDVIAWRQCVVYSLIWMTQLEFLHLSGVLLSLDELWTVILIADKVALYVGKSTLYFFHGLHHCICSLCECSLFRNG